MPKNRVPPFVDKLDQILESPQYHHIISWTPEGDAFVIKSVTLLINTVFPKYFKHRNYSSFNRQLNLYNFVKIRCETDENVYSNQYFLRYDKDQYRFIKRSKGDSKEEEEQLEVVNPRSVVGELKELGTRQFKLQEICKSIFHENQEIIRSNSKLWKKITQKLDIRNKQLSTLLYQLLLRIGNKQGLPNLQLLDDNEIHDENDLNSDSSESQQLIETPKSFTKQLLSYMENKNLNIQDILNYFNLEKMKKKEPLVVEKGLVEDPNLYIKENGESQRELSEKESDIISDVNHFLNRSESVKALSDYGI